MCFKKTMVCLLFIRGLYLQGVKYRLLVPSLCILFNMGIYCTYLTYQYPYHSVLKKKDSKSGDLIEGKIAFYGDTGSQ